MEILQKQLDEERNKNHVLRDENNFLKASLRLEHPQTLKHTHSLIETEEKEINQINPQKELTLMRNHGEHCCAGLKPII